MSEQSAILTPYAAWKIANAAILEAGLKGIPSQMLYNYTSGKLNKGERPLIAFTHEGGVDREDLQRWLKAYLTKKAGARATVADPEQYSFDAAEAH